MLQEKKIENFRISESRKIEKDIKATLVLQQKQPSISSLQTRQDSLTSLSTQPSSTHSVSQNQQQNNQQSCCPNSFTSLEIQTETDNEQKQFERRLNDYLPIKIGGIFIKRVQWCDFNGRIDPDLPFWAHIYWFINYNYQVEQRQNNFNRGLDYKVRNINVNVKISNKSWVRKQTDYLLSHEQGHYLIGCICALDFKQQILKKRFSMNYSNEITQIFNATLKYYSNMEIQYDEETNHSKHLEKQTQWFIFLYDQLKKYEEYFNPQSVLNVFQQKPLIENKENIPQNLNQNGQEIKKGLLPPIQKQSTSLSRPNKQSEKQDSRVRRLSSLFLNQKD